MGDAMSVSLTELRQRLFQLADHVAETGEPLIVMRKGVRLRLVRDDEPPQTGGKLARLRKQQAWIGPAPDPHYSPAEWSADSFPKVAEPGAPAYSVPAKTPRKRR